jgi:hypothetical protein
MRGLGMNLSRRGFLTGVAAAAVVSRLSPVNAAAISPEPILLQEFGEGTHTFSAYVKAPGDVQWTRVVRHFTPQRGELYGIGWDQVRREWMPRTFTLKDWRDDRHNDSGTFEVFGAQIETTAPMQYIETSGSKVAREAARTNLLIGTAA